MVHSVSDPSKKVAYGELIGGRWFDHPVAWHGVAQQLAVKVDVPLKKPSEFKVIGKTYPRRDMPGKVFGTLEQCADVRLPNMVHARTLRPTQAGSVPVTVDESSVANIPGVQVVHIKDFLAVVAEKEWNAVKAAKTLKVTWSPGTANYPTTDKLFDHMRAAIPRARSPERGAGGGGGATEAATGDGRSGYRRQERGNARPVNAALEAAFKRSAKVMTAEYEYPMQSHASMGPGVGVADVREDSATVWTSTQKPYDCQIGIADLLKMPVDSVRAIWKFGTGS